MRSPPPVPPGRARWSTLLLHTDGLIERRGETLDRGFDRLLAAARHTADGTAVDGGLLCDELLTTLFDGTRATDDVALLAVTLLPATTARRPTPSRTRPAVRLG